MSHQKLIIKYQGAVSDNHQIDMRQFGYSLIGIEKILRYGFICLSAQRIPKRGEESPVSIIISQPHPGSFSFETIIQEFVGSNYPLLNQFFIEQGHKISLKWLGGLLLNKGGRESEALSLARDLVQIMVDHDNRKDQRRHEEIMALINRPELNHAAKNIVQPVGKSSSELLITDGNGGTIKIDEPIADSIRSKDKLEVGNMEDYIVVVDGFTHHNKQLKIIHPEEPGRYINGNVRDPQFDHSPNIYTDAASHKSRLKVKAKPTLKEGRINTLYIFDAKLVE